MPSSDVPGEAAVAHPAVPDEAAAARRALGITPRRAERASRPESTDACRALFDSCHRRAHLHAPRPEAHASCFPGLHGGGNWGGGALDPRDGPALRRRQRGRRRIARCGRSRRGRAAAVRDGSGAGGRLVPRRERLALPGAALGNPQRGRPRPRRDRLEGAPRRRSTSSEARGVPKTGVQSLGGAIVTAGGLVFIGATVDQRFRAFDAQTGEELWSPRFPPTPTRTR